MTAKEGKINVKTENIFPIIKKFLYSDHEIFLRELVSNAVDAIQKLTVLDRAGEFKGKTGKLAVEVSVNKSEGTITVRDNGVGMTSSEIEKYINQIALSGAEEFISKYKDKAGNTAIIGHFGLGFYSAFMVSSKVEIVTRSWKKDSGAVKWECDGSPDYTLQEFKRERGTDVILHIAEDSKEFLEEERIRTILSKYCKFLPVEIKFGDKVINNTEPAWTKKPADLKDEDYKKFYRELYPYTFDDPLFHIHLNVDYPFNLTGILYFQRIKHGAELQKNKIQLYCNQVFVTDSVEGIVPDFLTILHGVIDSPDIPLNVSRSYLQSDANVKKISSHITKKVSDKLEETFKKNRKDFEAKWNDIKIFIEYGVISEEKFYERAKSFCLFRNTDDKYFTMEEYADKIKPVQTDKDKKLVYLYATGKEEQHAYICSANERGYDVLIFDTPISGHFIGKLEQVIENAKFVRVDADIIDKLINKDEQLPSKLSEKEKEELKPIIEGEIAKDRFIVIFESLSEKEKPILITQPEFIRRMKDMAVGGGMSMMGEMSDMHNLVVNTNHPLIGRILNEKDEATKKKLTKQAIDLALISQNLLRGEELTKFVARSLEMI